MLLVIKHDSSNQKHVEHNVNPEFSNREKADLHALLIEFGDVFSVDASQMGRTNLVQRQEMPPRFIVDPIVSHKKRDR